MRRPVSAQEVEQQIDRLVQLSHNDPHSVLGIHPDGDGIVVRTYRPDAESVTVLPDFGGRVPAGTGGTACSRRASTTAPRRSVT